MKTKIALLCAAAIGLAASSARADGPFMTGDQVTASISGKSLIYPNPRSGRTRIQVTFNPGGKLDWRTIGTRGGSTVREYSGAWSVKTDRLCWQREGAKEACYRVRKSGESELTLVGEKGSTRKAEIFR